MNAQTKERKKETRVINITLTQRGMALLAGALLIIALLAYMAWRQKAYAQSETLAPSRAPLASAGYISVPASAFGPTSDNYDYDNEGYSLKTVTGGGAFTAAPRLPHGATVTSMTAHFRDQDAVNFGIVEMHRTEFGTHVEMAQVYSADYVDSSSDTSINYAVIDNSQYSYYLYMGVLGPSITLYEVLIEFTYPVNHLPLIMRDY